jgi:hypothetical protein
VNWVGYLPYLPIIIGIVTGSVVLILLARGRKSSIQQADQDVPSEWRATDKTSYANRRNSVRRNGSRVRILVSSSIFPDGVESAFVLDRSTGGLRIATGAALPPGSSVQVRAANAPDTIPWVTIIVRSCKLSGGHYEMGCEFTETPPWSVLLLFG